MGVPSLCHLAAAKLAAIGLLGSPAQADRLGLPPCVLDREDVLHALARHVLSRCVSEYGRRTRALYAVLDRPRPIIYQLDAIRRMCMDWADTLFRIDFDTEALVVQLVLGGSSACICVHLGTAFKRNDGSIHLLEPVVRVHLGAPPADAFKKWY